MGKFKLDFEGIDVLSKRLESMNISVQETAEEALKETHAHVTKKIENAIANSPYDFNRTGKTKSTLQTEPKIEWAGSTASVNVGFDIANGGLPSLFLMHGTPSIDPDQALYDAVFGKKTEKEVADIQQNVFVRKLVKGGG